MQGLAKKFAVVENESEAVVDQDETLTAQGAAQETAEQNPVDQETAEAGHIVTADAATHGHSAEGQDGSAQDDARAETAIEDVATDENPADGAIATGDTADANPEAGDGTESSGSDELERPETFRLLEALLFASAEPLDEAALAKRLPTETNVREALVGLQAEYATRGVNLVRIGKKWTFRTANDLSWLLTKNVVQPRKLSRAAIETLAIIAYHQPVTRAEVEEVRGVAAAKGTLDVLLETGWIRPRGRRKVPGRPITYGTSDAFLSHFGLERVEDLPGLDELKGAGLLDGRLPPGFSIPMPSDDSTLRDDEDPLEPGDLLDFGLAPPPERTEGGSDGENT